MLIFKDLKNYTVEAWVGREYPVIVTGGRMAYRLDYQDNSYYLIDLLLRGRREKGEFLKVGDSLYLTYEEPCFYA